MLFVRWRCRDSTHALAQRDHTSIQVAKATLSSRTRLCSAMNSQNSGTSALYTRMHTLLCSCVRPQTWRRWAGLCDEESLPSDVDELGRDAFRAEATQLFKRRFCVCATALMGASVLVCFLGWWTWDAARGDALRPSDPVRRLHDDVSPRVRQFMWNWALAQPALCVVTAPHLRVYKNYAVMRIHGLPVPVANAAWHPAEDQPTETVREHSTMCNAKHNGVLRKRHRAGVFTYDSGDTGTSMTSVALSGEDAHCAQHLADLMRGEWPCPLDSPNVLDALRLPLLPPEWIYGDGSAFFSASHEAAGPSH